MLNIIFILGVLLLSVYVISPLFSQNDKTITVSGKKTAKLDDLVFQRDLLKNTIQELHFDHQMGKISDEDFRQIMSEHQESLSGLEKKIQYHSGKSIDTIREKLEREIARKKQNLNK